MQTTCHVSGQRRCPGKSPNPYFRSGSVSSQSTFQHPGPRTIPFATSQLLYEHPKPYESTVSSTYSASSSVATSEESSVAARPAATAASLAQIPTSTAHRFEALPSSACARPCVIPAVRAALAAALPAAAAACARRAKKAVGRLCPVAKNIGEFVDLRGGSGPLARSRRWRAPRPWRPACSPSSWRFRRKRQHSHGTLPCGSLRFPPFCARLASELRGHFRRTVCSACRLVSSAFIC